MLTGRDLPTDPWAMLCAAVKDTGREVWSLRYSELGSRGDTASAHWDVRYRFSATGRLVQNHVTAQLRFDAAGLIVVHVDRFDFWRWSRQALGAPGLLLGWTPYLRRKVREQARSRLERHLAR